MKTVTTLFVCLLSMGSTFSQAWFADNHTWVYRYFAPFSTEGYGEMRVDRDTLIDGRAAKVLITEYTAIEVAQSDSVFFTDQKIVYEEDSRVYLLTDFDYPDLLYDFNLEVGDSLSYWIRDNSGFCTDTIVYYLDSLSTTVLNNEELVVQHFSFYDINWEYEGTTTITEKVGRTNFAGNRLDHRTRHNCFFDAPGDWLCVFTEGTEKLKILDEDCYALPTIVSTDDIDRFGAKVYPNPVTEQLFIESGSSINRIQLYNMDGRFLYNYKPKASIDISKLNAGTYILRIEDYEGNLTQRHILKI